MNYMNNLERLRLLTTGFSSEVTNNLWPQIFDCIPVGILVSEADSGKIVLTNSELQDMFGYSWSLANGRYYVEELLPEELRDRHIQLRSEFAKNPIEKPMKNRDPLQGIRYDGSEITITIELNFFELPNNSRYLIACIRKVPDKNAPVA